MASNTPDSDISKWFFSCLIILDKAEYLSSVLVIIIQQLVLKVPRWKNYKQL